jgi:uncharacterized SAM-binding protein YcdF (DUF218 family)
MLFGANAVAGPRRHRSTRLIFVALLILFAAALIVVFFGVGRWLVVEDRLEKAQAIAVLSGDMPIRAIEAARLYREAYARDVWLTRPLEPAASLEALGITYPRGEFFNARVLSHEGVPGSAVHVLDAPIHNTADEMRVIAEELSREKGSAVILVTTKAHTRRVRLLWQRFGASHGRAIVRAAKGDSFDSAHWWRTTGDALDVVREVLGWLNAWAGLPVHPGVEH